VWVARWLRWGGGVGGIGHVVVVLLALGRGSGAFSGGGLYWALVAAGGHVLAPFWSLFVVRGGCAELARSPGTVRNG
jgi:hypothetical protein